MSSRYLKTLYSQIIKTLNFIINNEIIIRKEKMRNWVKIGVEMPDIVNIQNVLIIKMRRI